MIKILTSHQYYNEILIFQQHFIYNISIEHCKVPEIFQKPFQQLYKYSCNIARFQWNIFEIFPQYYGAMWVKFYYLIITMTSIYYNISYNYNILHSQKPAVYKVLRWRLG